MAQQKKALKPFISYVDTFELAMEDFLKVSQKHFKSWQKNLKLAEHLRNSLALTKEHARTLSPNVLKRLCEVILETRLLYDGLIEEYKKQPEEGRAKVMYGAILTGYGEEAIGASVAMAMRQEDWIARTHRDAAAAILRGTPVLQFFLNHFFKATGPTGGHDPNIHFCDLERNDLGFRASDMAMGAALINGAVTYKNLEKELRKGSALTSEERIAGVAISGDGAASNGVFLAAMNFAKARSLPVLHVIHNNQISLGTSALEQHGDIALSNRAFGFEMPGFAVDGDDALEMYLAAYWLLTFARLANHPALVEAITFRRHGHNESESTEYVKEIFDPEFLAKMMSSQADPLTRIRKLCEESGAFEKNGKNSFKEFRDAIRLRVKKAYEEALSAPDPLAHLQSWRGKDYKETLDMPDLEVLRANFRNSFMDPDCAKSKTLAKEHPVLPSNGRRISMKDAIKEALAEEFAKDPLLQMLGEDIGFPKGGVFSVTKGLPEKFGKDRIFNSTLDEAAIGAFAVGAALAGGRVIVEYQFANFFFAGPSPILTLAATNAFMVRAATPIVLRAPTGYAPSSNHYHENWIESYMIKALGIKVVVPSTPEDAKGLLKSAICDDDPVYIGEEMSFYSLMGEVPEGEYFIPLGVAKVRREGKDISLITWGPKMMDLAVKSAEILAQEGIGLEIIDLRTLWPWDRETVLNSVAKTGRALILYGDSKAMGFGAEISATISEEITFYHLKARVKRLAALNTPIPGNRELEDIRLPQMNDMLRVCRELMEES